MAGFEPRTGFEPGHSSFWLKAGDLAERWRFSGALEIWRNAGDLAERWGPGVGSAAGCRGPSRVMT